MKFIKKMYPHLYHIWIYTIINTVGNGIKPTNLLQKEIRE